MKIVVTTCDPYLPALRPFAHLLNKYWRPLPDVLVAGFAEPKFSLPDNFKFISLGKLEDYPAKKWSNALIKLLDWMDEEVFVLMLEDYWIVRHVNVDAVQKLYDYAKQFHYVLKVDLCADRLYAHGADLTYDYLNYLDLVKSMPGSPYHMSLYPGVWRKDNMLKVLIPDESPHDVELVGTTRVSQKHADMLVVGTRQWPLRITLGLRALEYDKVNLSGLRERDIKELRDLGYLDYWEKDDG